MGVARPVCVRAHLELSGQRLGRLGQERPHQAQVRRQRPRPLQGEVCAEDVHDQPPCLLGFTQIYSIRITTPATLSRFRAYWLSKGLQQDGKSLQATM